MDNTIKNKLYELKIEAISILLTELMIKIDSSIKGKKTKNQFNFYKYGFFLKLLYHFQSIRMLTKRTKFIANNEERTFCDMSSINILIRACFECYFTFSYIYVIPESRDFKKFRFALWRRSGLKTRQKFSAILDESKTKLIQEAAIIKKIEVESFNSIYFNELEPNERKEIMKGKWRPTLHSWKRIAMMSGFNKQFAKNIYSFLSGYTHSDYISIMQITQMKNVNEVEEMNEAFLRILFIVYSKFLNEFMSTFHDVSWKLSEAERNILKAWHSLLPELVMP